MIRIGYLAKRIESKRPDWLAAPDVTDVYSVSGCVNDILADYVPEWKDNGFWVFDSPDAIRATAQINSISLQDAKLFYYEAYELEFDDDQWFPFAHESSIETNVIEPTLKTLEGFDVVSFSMATSPECSPLSCNSMAVEIPTNSRCLFATRDEALNALNANAFKECEPGPYRVFAVYSVDWPDV